jgi:hypothetical protein
VDVRLLDHCLGGFYSVTTAAKIHQSLGFPASIANKGFNRRMVTLLAIGGEFHTGEEPPESGLEELLVATFNWRDR